MRPQGPFRCRRSGHGGRGEDLVGTGRRGAVLIVEEAGVLLAGEEARGDGIHPDATLLKWTASHWVKLVTAALEPE